MSLPTIRPDEERGRALLVVGATADARARWLDEALAALAREDGAPVIVRVPVGSAALEDVIAAAAEDALRAARAPGGLYDDPGGGPFASLGGWLFRARAVGRRGIVVVLEDIDARLDTRGASGAPDARAMIERALDECARRAMSLVATVRASDASGGAALPAELVARFETVHTLGGARTVSRDPSSLLPHLVGRSFTLPALRAALAGWLEVPEADEDTAIVFSAPFAPPHVGLASEEALEWAARPSEPAPATAPSSAQSTPLGDGWAEALRAAMQVRTALEAMPNGASAQSVRQLERVFRESVVHLPAAVATLERGERALGIEPTRLSRAAREAQSRFESTFAKVYADVYPTWLAGATRPTMLCDLPERLARVATESHARSTAFLIVSGLRYDLWLRVRSRVLPRVPGLQLLDEGAHWSARPPSPRLQRELLARGLSALGAELPPRDEPPAPRSLDEGLRPRREHLGRYEVLRIDAYAAELTRGERPMLEVAAEIEARLPSMLLALCGGFSGRTVIGLAGDVGLVEDRNASAPRFRSGGDSPFEAIVPFAVLLWG